MELIESAKKYLDNFHRLQENIKAGDDILENVKLDSYQISLEKPCGFSGGQSFEISNSDMLIALIETELQRLRRKESEMLSKLQSFLQDAV